MTGLPSGTLADTESTHCEGFDENDRRTVCIEDLRESAQTIDDSDDASTRKRKEATCGLGEARFHASVSCSKLIQIFRSTIRTEFLDGFEPDSCPVGFVRIGEDPGAKDQFICQDAASPYSVRRLPCDSWRLELLDHITDSSESTWDSAAPNKSIAPLKKAF